MSELSDSICGGGATSSDPNRTKYEELCRELNMDRETELTAWQKYSEISKSFLLEGDQQQWFCCALYAACRESYTPTVGETNSVVMGNCVSLNNLLRCCQTSIYDFFLKIKNWCGMGDLSPAFLHRIKKLEHNFTITFCIFHRFDEIYAQVFLSPPHEKRSTKYRSAHKCNSQKLYDYVWCLYLCAKNENPNGENDNEANIVSSFNLLICCIDYVYGNVLAECRIDLINPKFDGVPEHWNTPEFKPEIAQHYSVIEQLCKVTTVSLADVMAMKDSVWPQIVKKFFESETLFGNEETLLDTLSNVNFERNAKSLNASYEQYVLSVGEFDERIFLSNPKYRKLNSADLGDSTKFEHPQEVRSLFPNTPYTRKHILPNKELIFEPIAKATNNVKKLQDIANVKQPTDFIKQADAEVLQQIEARIGQWSTVFHAKFPKKSEATQRFQLAKSLYYYLMDKIVRVEMMSKPNIDLKVLLENDRFNMTLFACSIEIVLNAYYSSNSQLQFPWILDCFSINAFNFCKIIEIVVRRHDEILTRELIKHLNFVEETCLESLAWQKTSPVWEIIKTMTNALPTWAEVDVDNKFKRSQPQLQSPMNSAYETFNNTAAGDSARRDLFNTAKETPSCEKPPEGSKKPAEDFKRAGSLSIFLRKFYKLGWVRMKELCDHLGMGEEKFLNKIWTLFEYSITQRTDLMRDRHLDQILMCAIYIYIKVGEMQGKKFADIMTEYRKQPQSNSSIYREVLVDATDVAIADEKKKDIIYFYNHVYVTKMSSFAVNFSETQKSQHDLLLSPHPTERQSQPKKLSNQLYIHTLEKKEHVHSPNHITYEISKSPAKDLERINEIVRNGKRNLPFNDDHSSVVVPSKVVKEAPFYLNTIRGMMNDRQEERN